MEEDETGVGYAGSCECHALRLLRRVWNGDSWGAPAHNCKLVDRAEGVSVETFAPGLYEKVACFEGVKESPTSEI